MSAKFPVSVFIAEELEARGWSLDDAVDRLSGDRVRNAYWFELVSSHEIWTQSNAMFTDRDAERLAVIFGTSTSMS